MPNRTSETCPDRADSLNELLVPALPPAYRLAVSLTGDRVEAEDLVQEAALNACRGFDRFQEGTNFKAWFFKIVYHVFISQYRRRRRAGCAVSLDDEDRPSEAELLEQAWSEPGPDPLAAFLRQADSAEILAAIGALPEEYRVVSALYFVDDLSYLDIAQVVGTPIGTVRSRLHRGRALLKQALRGLAAERGIGVQPVAA